MYSYCTKKLLTIFQHYKYMIYRRIQEIARERGLTILEVAEKIGMSNGLYRTLRNKSLKVETLEKIAKVLNVDIEDFFWEQSQFKTNGTDLKLVIGLYKELINRIIDENPGLNNRDRIIQLFDNYNNLINLDDYNWTKIKWEKP